MPSIVSVRVGTLRSNRSNQRRRVSGRYYSSVIDEQGSFVYPGLFPTEAVAPLCHVFPITMRNRTREATVDANLAYAADLLGGTHKLLAGVNYDWTSFYSAMGLLVGESPSGTIDLLIPSYDLRYTPQLPVNC